MKTFKKSGGTNMKTWSAYQQAIFDFVKSGNGNAVVQAVAGSGKTTTIVEALKQVKGTSIFLAFNKSIAEELKSRGVNARTFHSLTYGPVLQSRKARTVDANKLHRIIDQLFSQDEKSLYSSFCARLVGLGRQSGIGCLLPNFEAQWSELIEHHDLELESELASMPEAIRLTQKLLDASNASALVDFDDLLYFAVRDGVTLPKFDFVFVDEAQDTNAIQRAILTKIMYPNSRIVAVGDKAQAIYGFRGADSNSLGLIKSEFNCKELPLTVSYRCPSNVITFVRQWVEHIDHAPNAPEGKVEVVGEKWSTNDFKASDLVVCRTTRPLIALGYSLLKANRPFYIMGKDIGQGLKSLVKKMGAKSIDQLCEKLDAWRMREVEKAMVKKQDQKVEQINDKVDALFFLIEGLNEQKRSIIDLCAVIDTMFQERGQATVLATIHKAKGLEADKVFWLNSSQCPAKWVKQEWQLEQEKNLCYVAATRSKNELILIEENKKAA